MDQADSGFDLVFALPTGSMRFVGIDSAILKQSGLITEKALVALIHGRMVTSRRAAPKDNPEFRVELWSLFFCPLAKRDY